MEIGIDARVRVRYKLINSKGTDKMIDINETTDRATLEIAAIFECNFNLDLIEAATDEELRNMIIDWIEAGDECGGC